MALLVRQPQTHGILPMVEQHQVFLTGRRPHPTSAALEPNGYALCGAREHHARPRRIIETLLEDADIHNDLCGRYRRDQLVSVRPLGVNRRRGDAGRAERLGQVLRVRDGHGKHDGLPILRVL